MRYVDKPRWWREDMLNEETILKEQLLFVGWNSENLLKVEIRFPDKNFR